MNIVRFGVTSCWKAIPSVVETSGWVWAGVVTMVAGDGVAIPEYQ